MSPPRTYKTEAVVLRQVPTGEADGLLVLLTPDRGKVRAIARGVRKPASKLRGHVEPLGHVSLMLALGQGLATVAQARLLDAQAPWRDDLDALARAWYLADLVDAFTEEESPNAPLYELLVEALRRVVAAPDPALLLRAFEARLLVLVGYRPELQVCVACRGPLASGALVFSLADGGVLCPACRPGQERLAPLSEAAVEALRLFFQGAPARMRRQSWQGQVPQEVERVLGQYIRYLLERDVRSAAFLRRLESGQRQAAGVAQVF